MKTYIHVHVYKIESLYCTQSTATTVVKLTQHCKAAPLQLGKKVPVAPQSYPTSFSLGWICFMFQWFCLFQNVI